MAKRSLDLSECEAKLEWAEGQIPSIAAAQAELVAKHTRETFGLRRTYGQPDRAFQQTSIDQFTAPKVLAVSIGSILHEQRSALDLMMCEIASRNGGNPKNNPHFPIRKDEHDFHTDGRVKRYLQDMTDREKEILVGLKPWKGGHPQIHLMNELDVLHKHKRLIAAYRYVTGMTFEGNGWMQHYELEKIGDDAMLSMQRTGTLQFVPTVELVATTNDGSVVPLLRALQDFGAAVRDILKLFAAEAAREAKEGA